MDIILTIPKNIKLTTSENYFHNFIINNAKIFVSSSISTIAKKSHVGIATISRFVRKMGFESFKELQMHIYKQYTHSLELKDYKIVESNEVKDTINNVNLFSSYAIETTINAIDSKELNNLIKLINKSSKLMIYGAGNSQTATREFALNLQKMGYFVVTNQDFHQILTTIPFFKKNDIIFIFSKSFKTKECRFISNLAKRLEIYLVIITNNVEEALKIKPNFIFKTITLEGKYNNSLISSIVSQTCISQIITNELLKLNFHFNKYEKMKKIIIEEWNKFTE